MNVLPQRYEVRSVESLTPHPRNVNTGNRSVIAESIDTNGWFGAVLVQESTGHIIAGTHRWLEAKEAGATEVPALILDVDDDQAERIMLVDNRSARLGEDRPPELAQLLSELAEGPQGLTGLGYQPADLTALLDDLETTELFPDGIPPLQKVKLPATPRHNVLVSFLDERADEVHRALDGLACEGIEVRWSK